MNNRVARMHFWSARKQEGRSPAHWAASGLLLSSSPLDTGKQKGGSAHAPSPLSTPQVSFPPMVSTEATLWHLVITNNYLGGREPTGTRKGGTHRQNRKGRKYRLTMAGWHREQDKRVCWWKQRKFTSTKSSINPACISHRLTERQQTLCGPHTPEIFKLIDFWTDKFLSSEYEFLEVISLCLSHLESTVNSQ